MMTLSTSCPLADRMPGALCDDRSVAEAQRFMTLADVAEVLNISSAQTYALVRSGDLAAIKIGGRGQWRVERAQLEDYIARMYKQTADFVTDHPLGRVEEPVTSDDPDTETIDAEGDPETETVGTGRPPVD